jgi:hypothetical protein
MNDSRDLRRTGTEGQASLPVRTRSQVLSRTRGLYLGDAWIVSGEAQYEELRDSHLCTAGPPLLLAADSGVSSVTIIAAELGATPRVLSRGSRRDRPHR